MVPIPERSDPRVCGPSESFIHIFGTDHPQFSSRCVCESVHLNDFHTNYTSSHVTKPAWASGQAGHQVVRDRAGGERERESGRAREARERGDRETTGHNTFDRQSERERGERGTTGYEPFDRERERERERERREREARERDNRLRALGPSAWRETWRVDPLTTFHKTRRIGKDRSKGTGGHPDSGCPQKIEDPSIIQTFVEI